MMNQFWTGHVFIHFTLNFLRGPTLGSLIIDIFLHLPQLGNFTRGAWTDKRCPFLPLKMTLSFGQMLFNQHIMASQLVNTKLCERMCADFQPNDLVSNFRVIYIYTYADWLTEWGMLRARLHFLPSLSACTLRAHPYFLLACACNTLSPSLSLSLWPVNRMCTSSSPVREKEREM
jgi:hypothetical protein